MCGICGILHFDKDKKADEGLLRRMAGVMSHRGPDDEGYLVDGQAGLGHRRLSIIDLTGGHQPIPNEDNSQSIVFNGEIYNYKSLADDLKQRGHIFRTRSDTETILHAWEEFGTDCVHHLRGMFAFAIWDSNNRRLFLVRDRVGIKPVYYTIHQGCLYFASEIKALLQERSIPREINLEALDLFLTFRYVPGPQTLFKGIYKLPAGAFLLAGNGNHRVETWWDIEYGQPSGDAGLESWVDRFEQAARSSVEMRLMSEVPLGAFLSGGIDSSLTVAFMSSMINEPVNTFSVGYENKPEINEFSFARQVARRYETNHRELEISAGKFSELIPRLVWHLDEPVADAACLPLLLLSDLTRRHVTVILSGEGADEMLAGYYLYQKMMFIERLRALPGLGGLLSGLSPLAPEGKLRRYMRQAGQPLNQRYRGVSVGFTDEQRRRLYPESRMNSDQMQQLTRSFFDRVAGQHPLNQMLYFDTRVYLVDDLLVKADKMTMASSLELRVPFLDHRLMEMAARLPVEAKLKGDETKRIFRRMARPLLPPDILNRSKRGFPVPTRQWFAGDLNQFARDRLLGSDCSLRGLFDMEVIQRLLDRHVSGKEQCEDRIWPLLVLESWKRVFIDGPDVVAP
jgi:asparagine synthase (glutamine-hydrolysing)